jgi:serine/threonine-protein kinase
VFYVVATWLVLQVADVLFSQLGVPDWSFSLVLGLLILGFPLVLIFSWVFEMTPEGIKLERDIERGQSITGETGRKLNITIVVLLVLAIAGLIADRLIPESGTTTLSGPVEADQTPAESDIAGVHDRSIAVLPFANMSGDPDNEYFSDGLSEELLNSLVQIKDLQVTGRTSSFAFRGQNLDLRDIGRQLNVAHVLEGSVRKAGNRVRITAQLIKTSDGYHLWSEAFDRELDDIFAIQQEIASQVATALSTTLLGVGESSAVGSTNTLAYEEYLRGMYIHQRQPDDLEALRRAEEFFEKALAIDDQFAPGYYGLFRVWNRMNRNGHVPFDESLEEMRENTERLEQLAPGSAHALQARARLSYVTLDWHAAAAAVEEAYRKYPGNAEVLLEYAALALMLEYPEKAFGLINKAIALDPLSLEAERRLGLAAMSTGQCDTARDVADRALAIDRGLGRFRYFLAVCLFLYEDDPEAARALAQDEPVDFAHHTALAIIDHRMGNLESAREHLQFMEESYKDTASFQYAQVHAQWGNTERALDWLQKALDVHDPGIVTLMNDGFLDPLRGEARFNSIMEQAGFTNPPELTH